MTTEYVLDWNKWRCGGVDSDNMLGEGSTYLLNNEDYQCCLGQFAEQDGVPRNYLLKKQEPFDVGYAYNPMFIRSDDTANTHLTEKLMNINDDKDTTPYKKIEMIRTKLERHGYSLKVINQPE